MKQTERSLQRAILDYLDRLNIFAAHIPNGAVLAGNPTQRARQMNSLKRDGLRNGMPDLLLISKNGSVGFCEVKLEGARTQPSQHDMHALLRGRGQSVAVVRSVADVQDTLKEWKWI